MTIEEKIRRHILRGEPMVAHELQDREKLEWVAKRLFDKTIRFEENHIRFDGFVERFIKPIITVYDCHQIPRDEAKWLVENRPVQDWLTSLVDAGGSGLVLPDGRRVAQPRPLEIILAVHPERWEISVRAFRALGYTVTNEDAPFTSPSSLWCEPKAVA